MGGVIGATSGKFVMAAASLMAQGRIEGTRVTVAIVPGAPTSAISAALAERLGGQVGGPDGYLRLGLHAQTLRVRIAAVEPAPAQGAAQGAAVRIGQDVLAEQPIAIDFARRTLEPLTPAAAQRAERAMTPVAVTREADGTLSVAVTVAGGAPVRALLDLTATTGVAGPGLAADATVKLGAVALRDVAVTQGAQAVVGLYAFRRARVIFDLGHDRVWVAP